MYTITQTSGKLVDQTNEIFEIAKSGDLDRAEAQAIKLARKHGITVSDSLWKNDQYPRLPLANLLSRIRDVATDIVSRDAAEWRMARLSHRNPGCEYKIGEEY